MKQNNILFIMTDQWRWDALGSVGGWVKTPHLDSIAEEGIYFDNCVTTSPLCVPSRISMATGRYPHNTGIWENLKYDLPKNSETWMQRVQEAGYRTCLIGKSHLHRHQGDLRNREDYIQAYGFEDVNEIPGPRRCMDVKSHMTEMWENLGVLEDYINDYKERFAGKPYVSKPSPLPLELYADVYVGQKAKQYLQAYNDSRPWMCMVSFGGPHEPWDAPEPYASMYDPADMPDPIPKQPLKDNPPNGKLDEFLSPEHHYSPPMTSREVAKLRANYAGNITLIDDQIGEIIQVIKEKGEWDNTIIVFLSDHGEMNGDHGLLYKCNFLNSSVKVPFLVRAPEIISKPQAGIRYSGMVELFDIGPTLCELAGGEIYPNSERQFAKSLAEVLRNPQLIHRESAISEIYDEVMIQDEEWKMAVNSEGSPYLLYHLSKDPEEQNNLIGDTASEPIVREMKEKLLQRLLASQSRYV